MLRLRTTETTWFGTGNCARLLATGLLLWSTIVYPVAAEAAALDASRRAEAIIVAANDAAPAADAAKADEDDEDAVPPYSVSDLEYLLGPIALYPDSLLALILSASTNPLHLVHAERWLIANQDAVDKDDFTGADELDLDAAVIALMRFPDIVEMLNDHLDWAESLGVAFEHQPEDVATVIQLLRAKAEQQGNLKTTSEQVVTVTETAGNSAGGSGNGNAGSGNGGGNRTIVITPANPERIYVPVYDPAVVFVQPAASLAVPALAFTTGVIVGSSWNNRWGWNNRGWNNVWVTHNWVGAPGWQAPPARPLPPPGVWRPDRPNRPGNRPGVRPDRPDRPGSRPGRRPGDRPNARPRPGNRPEVRPERPHRPNRPERPAARPGRPGESRRQGNRQQGNRQQGNRRNEAGQQRNRQQQDNRQQGNRQQGNRQNAGQPQRNRPQQGNRQPQRNPQQGQRNRQNAGQGNRQNRNAGAPNQRNRQQNARPQQQRNRPQNARPQQQQQRRQQHATPNRNRQGGGNNQQRRGGGNNCRPGQNGRCR